MTVSRRNLLLAALAAPVTVRRARLRPGLASALGFAPLPHERVAFQADGVAGTIVIPVARAGIRAVLPVADRDVALLSFAADPPAGTLDMAAIVGWDGTALRLLALEILRWQAGDAPLAAHLSTRIKATADRSRLLLERAAAAPRSGLPLHRESWTDLLAWHPAAAMTDAPAHATPAGLWQRRLADDRARMIARLARPCDALTDDVLALCRPPDLSPP